jgi:anaerobic magnesium-protoporphyrin IX monomethyl ester cyclase
MQVGLIIPPSPFLLDERVFVSLGVLYVASSLESQGVDVALLDLSGVADYESAVGAFVESQPSLLDFGITSTTPQYPAAIKIAKQIKKLRPTARTAIGGAHPTTSWFSAKNTVRGGRVLDSIRSNFDAVIVGDGEFTWPWSSSLVVGDHRGSTAFLNDLQINALPLPARHLVDLKSYHYSIDGHAATNMITQRGCPFGCGFCGGRSSPTMRGLRRLDTRHVVDELEQLYVDYGYTGAMFFDDEVTSITA